MKRKVVVVWNWRGQPNIHVNDYIEEDDRLCDRDAIENAFVELGVNSMGKEVELSTVSIHKMDDTPNDY